jgi:hypothetical protein
MIAIVGAALAVASTASAQKAALGVKGEPAAAVRDAWKKWIGAGAWIEAPAKAVDPCVKPDDAACARELTALAVDLTYVLVLEKSANPLLVGRVYGPSGALIESAERPCAGCTDRGGAAAVKREVPLLLDLLRDKAVFATTHLAITRVPDTLKVSVV